MKSLLIILSLIVLGTVSINALAKDKKNVPEYTVEGLKLVPDSKNIALVWAKPGADLAQYDRIYMLDPYVAFKKNWQRDHNRDSMTRVRTNDMERIKKAVKELFIEVFTEELEKGGYKLTTDRAVDVLVVRPAVIDLDVNAPDIMTSGRSTTLTDSAGSMTLYLELYDAETEDLLAKAMDAKADRGSNFMQWASRSSNRAAGKRMMRPWALALVNGLDEARDVTRQDKG